MARYLPGEDLAAVRMLPTVSAAPRRPSRTLAPIRTVGRVVHAVCNDARRGPRSLGSAPFLFWHYRATVARYQAPRAKDTVPRQTEAISTLDLESAVLLSIFFKP